MRKIFSNKLLLLIVILASVLRLYKLSVNPPSLFGDELDLGYQAYSILKTGRDYQGNLIPLNFHSIAEWRTPLYLYTAVPTIAVFGITPLGVRLPAAIFGILDVIVVYFLFKEILSFGQPPTNKHYRSLVASFLFVISPWSLQYSRAGFEVTEMLFFLTFGLLLFFKSLKNPKWLWVSVLCLMLTPFVYSTAKLFTPILMLFLLVTFRKNIFGMPKKNLLLTMFVGLVVALPLIYATFFGGGTQRIGDISVLKDGNMEQVVGANRAIDAKAGSAAFVSKLINNKFTYFGSEIVGNYLAAFSPQFLFLKGDINLRQSVGTGELYLVEIIPLLFGLAYFLTDKRDIKIKALMFVWLLLGVLPAALTLNGGTHATRLILILPPLIFFISYGLVAMYRLAGRYQKLFLTAIGLIYIVSLGVYLHRYYYSYVLESEHSWHYGWCPAINKLKSIDKDYDRVVISMKGEPAWIFFAACYQYDPKSWQKNFPIGHDETIPGFGTISHIDKYYFGSPLPDIKIQIYAVGDYMDSRTLYLANASEDAEDLIIHPEREPRALNLIYTIPFPSGEPAFYLFAGEK